jgi:hypothetical protein
MTEITKFNLNKHTHNQQQQKTTQFTSGYDGKFKADIARM